MVKSLLLLVYLNLFSKIYSKSAAPDDDAARRGAGKLFSFLGLSSLATILCSQCNFPQKINLFCNLNSLRE